MAEPNCVYVLGIREIHTENALKEYFEQFGHVYEVNIVKHFEGAMAGKPLGFAFVKFCDVDAANKCLRQKFHVVQGETCGVDNAKSKSIDERAERIAQMLRAMIG